MWLSPCPCVGDCPLKLTLRGSGRDMSLLQESWSLQGGRVQGPDLEGATRPSETS